MSRYERILRALGFAGSSWFDPAALTANTFPQFTDITLAANTPQKILPANPRRWMLGIAKLSIVSVDAIGPWPDINSFNILWLPAQTQQLLLTQFSVGPIIQSEWWAKSTIGGDIRVIEAIRQ